MFPYFQLWKNTVKSLILAKGKNQSVFSFMLQALTSLRVFLILHNSVLLHPFEYSVVRVAHSALRVPWEFLWLLFWRLNGFQEKIFLFKFFLILNVRSYLFGIYFRAAWNRLFLSLSNFQWKNSHSVSFSLRLFLPLFRLSKLSLIRFLSYFTPRRPFTTCAMQLCFRLF